jgi:hypothetical protein
MSTPYAMDLVYKKYTVNLTLSTHSSTAATN